MWYLRLRLPSAMMRWGLLGAIGITALAVLSTQSRGAFLAICAMGAFLWLKSPKKIWTGLALVVAAPILFAMMPASWHERMATIGTYQEDGSAMGRINAWHFAWNLAKERPLIGGGFDTFTPGLFQRYAPDPEDFHDAHSIYFQVLGEHGFVGLGLFLGLLISALLTGQGVIRRARGDPELEWAADLAAMVQVSIVGFMVGGAFLGLAYFDLFYHLVAILLILSYDVNAKVAAAEASGRSRRCVPACRRPHICSDAVERARMLTTRGRLLILTVSSRVPAAGHAHHGQRPRGRLPPPDAVARARLQRAPPRRGGRAHARGHAAFARRLHHLRRRLRGQRRGRRAHPRGLRTACDLLHRHGLPRWRSHVERHADRDRARRAGAPSSI
jgi:hypothetical protein